MAQQSKIERLRAADLVAEDADEETLAEIEASLTDEDVDHLVRVGQKIRPPGAEKGRRPKIIFL